MFLLKNQGISLVECMLVIALTGLLMTWSIPRFSDVFANQQHKAVLRALVRAARFARISAININQDVSLEVAGENWCRGFQVTSQVGLILKAWHFSIEDCHITWSSFPVRNYLRFTPEGTTDYQNGRFKVYIKNDLLGSVIVSQTGRVRLQD